MECKCGFENAEDAKYCGNCRLALGDGPGNAVPKAAESSTALPMKCKCGFENAADAKFCGRCRSALRDSPGSVIPIEAAASPEPRRPIATGHRRTPARPLSRVGITLVAIVVAFAAAGYWWMNRPPGVYKPDNAGLYPIRVNGKYGFMDHSGKTLITPQFDQTYGFSEGLAPVQIGTKWGYINTKGGVAITPQFDLATLFQYGRASVKLADRWGFIDKNGKYISSPSFLLVGSFTGDYAPVRTEGGEDAFVSRSGKIVLSGKYESTMRGFTEGIAPVASGGKWGFVDTMGKWVVDPQFELAFRFGDGLAPVKVGERWGYIDHKGKFVVNPQYDLGGEFYNGYAIFWNGGKAGFIDTKGRVVCDAKYLDAGHFTDGLGPVKTEDGWGFIDPKGKMVVSPQFDSAEPFQNGLARVTAIGKEAYITTAGAFVTDPFPGTTVKAIKERMTETAQTRERIVGCWTGRFSDMAFAQMVISTDGAVVVSVPVGQGWREVLRGTLDSETIGATLVGANGKTTDTYKATLNFNESNDSLTGDLANANRSKVGRITLERCID